MSSIQEHLQLKRIPLDTWNTREQLCLASAVVRSGDQNWMSVSRALKTVAEPNRPPDWYSQKSCAAQYGALLEHVETPKRKKRSSEGAVETPQESILKRLTQERMVEIQKNVAEMNQQYEQLRDEINEVRNTSTSEERLRELLSGIEAAKRTRERENAKRALWLKEREERRARAERTWRPPTSSVAVSPPLAVPPSSPLLTSLLKSSPVVTTPQHISHPANVVETISPSAGAPTLSMLLENKLAEKQVTSQHDNKYAAIEQIKNQLVQIENQLKANPSTPSPVPLPPAPAVDIDDIEIKAEDVYAFRDIDLHIPPVASMHKATTRTEKPYLKKDEEPIAIEQSEVVEEKPSEEEIVEIEKETEAKIGEVEESISFPEVKFPTTEIKVIQPDEQSIKEEIKEIELVSVPESEKEEIVEEVQVEDETAVDIENESTITEEVVETAEVAAVDQTVVDDGDHQIATGEVEITTNSQDTKQVEEQTAELSEEKQETKKENDESRTEENQEENSQDRENEKEKPVTDTDENAEGDSKRDDAEDTIPLQDIKEELKDKEIKEEITEAEETHTETDDDTPMEVVREEDGSGKRRRDYSRKRAADPRADSPAERDHRLWKKSVLLVYSRLCAHKYASLFLRPITDEEAPGYSMVVKKPMDLTTIKKHVESGTIRTTSEFQRLVLLMLSNALMYNNSEHSVHAMAKELYEEATHQVGMLLAAQAVAGLQEPPARRKRRRDQSPMPPHFTRNATTPKQMQ